MNIETQIIAGFPGTGKTSFYNTAKNTSLTVIDSDSSQFNKKGFPDNYIEHIKSNIGEVDIILVSSHKEVRDALVKNSIHFTLVYPNYNLKNEYLERYKLRGNSSQFIELIEKNWEAWIDECMDQKYCSRTILPTMIFIADVI